MSITKPREVFSLPNVHYAYNYLPMMGKESSVVTAMADYRTVR